MSIEREQNTNKIALILQKISGEDYEVVFKIAKKFEEDVFTKTATKEEYFLIIKEKLKKIIEQAETERTEEEKQETETEDNEVPVLRKTYQENSVGGFTGTKGRRDLLGNKERVISAFRFIRKNNIGTERMFFLLENALQKEKKEPSRELIRKWKNKITKINGPVIVMTLKDRDVLIKVNGDECVFISPMNTSNKDKAMMNRLNQEIYRKRITKADDCLSVLISLL